MDLDFSGRFAEMQAEFAHLEGLPAAYLGTRVDGNLADDILELLEAFNERTQTVQLS